MGGTTLIWEVVVEEGLIGVPLMAGTETVRGPTLVGARLAGQVPVGEADKTLQDVSPDATSYIPPIPPVPYPFALLRVRHPAERQSSG